jgi:uncharacterized integral membrane protein
MRGAVILLVVAFLAAMVFALSNTMTVPVMFWQWQVYNGPLALALVGAGILGALLAFLPSIARHAHLRGRVHELERRLAQHERPAPEAPAPASPPFASRPAVPPTPAAPASPVPETRPPDIGQTRRLW